MTLQRYIIDESAALMEDFNKCRKEIIRELENITWQDASKYGATYYTKIDQLTAISGKIEEVMRIFHANITEVK